MMLRKVKSLLIKLVGGANAATVLIAILTGYSSCFDAETSPLLSCSGLAFPAFMIINALFLLFWLFFWWRGAIIPLLGFLLCYFPLRDFCPINLPSNPPDDAIQLLSMNVMQFKNEMPADSVDALHTIIRYLDMAKPDIACFQEVPPQRYKWEQLGGKGRYIEDVDNNSGNVLLMVSRFLIIGKERIPYESLGNLSAAFHLLIDSDTVTVVSNHFQSFNLSEEERSEVGKIISGRGNRDPRSEGNRLLISKVVATTRYRAPQIKAVTHYIDSLLSRGRSVIVCGDFNETPVSFSHRQMEKRLTDCYSSTATGPGFTFERNGMHFRIDHIFCSPDWTPYNCQVVDRLHASDHYPLRCRLKKRSKR
ncbi:MAG: endonuclease/exonuclease/phosphatase family protein [Prevotella sp.]|uniref:endonuclease/exonuclease/phosphatase family protein n=1 Tax=Prevotella sp. TaxID=59823 RepID=UPI002A29F8E1|nr:endonuclease/exonuclease/phosphatase family protein [Prevotella sp.]MDD7318924.1 endonuclease/exonuclease/phosphatase family protein [Prevotellaceae bacterium]MDY4019950.1 endonuclease/exonuclease/phosphatase family protein [Prevotella sp.]